MGKPNPFTKKGRKKLKHRQRNARKRDKRNLKKIGKVIKKVGKEIGKDAKGIKKFIKKTAKAGEGILEGAASTSQYIPIAIGAAVLIAMLQLSKNK